MKIIIYVHVVHHSSANIFPIAYIPNRPHILYPRTQKHRRTDTQENTYTNIVYEEIFSCQYMRRLNDEIAQGRERIRSVWHMFYYSSIMQPLLNVM